MQKHPASSDSTILVDSLPADGDASIGIFDSGSGGMLTAAWVSKIAAEAESVTRLVFVGDTANLPYGTKPMIDVASLADGLIDQLSPHCPVIGIACNTASAAWEKFGRRGRGSSPPKIISIIEVGAEQVYGKARVAADSTSPRRCKRIGVLGTELVADCQAHAERLVEIHRDTLSHALGHELPLIPYEPSDRGLAPGLGRNVIHYERTPHLAVSRQTLEPGLGPGGILRAHLRNYEPPLSLAHDLEVTSRAAQQLVGFVDVSKVFTRDGLLKDTWAEPVRDYLRSVSRFFQQRQSTALLLGCTHFEYFVREFSDLLPGMAARGGIVSQSGTLAWSLLDAFREYQMAHPSKLTTRTGGDYFYFTGPRPPTETFSALGLSTARRLNALTSSIP